MVVTVHQELFASQMWAQTIDGADELLEKGLPFVLIGGLKDFKLDDYLFHKVSSLLIDLPVDKLAVAPTYCCRSLYKPVPISGKCQLYKAGDTALAEMEMQDTAVEIQQILLIIMEERPVQFVVVDTYRRVAKQPRLDTWIVVGSQTRVVISVDSIKRKVMLLPTRVRLPGVQTYTLIDHLRPFPISCPQNVIVPYYPTMNIMVLVQGSDKDPWRGRVISHNTGSDLVSVAFYIEDGSHRGVWVKESRRVDKVNINSIVGVGAGQWIGHSFLTWHEHEEQRYNILYA